jgi:hypothetical protein
MKKLLAVALLGFSFAAFADDAPPADAKKDEGSKDAKGAKKGHKGGKKDDKGADKGADKDAK